MKRFQYQRLAQPIAADAAPSQGLEWAQPQSQPLRKIVRFAALAAFFFSPISADSAPPETTQPYIQISQPTRIVERRAEWAPYHFSPVTADVVAPDLRPLEQQPQIPVRLKSRVYVYPTHFGVITEGSPPCDGGVTQPGGAGTTIYIYNDLCSLDGISYKFDEISAAFPSDFISNGTNKPSYRAKVTLQVGRTGTDAATTTLEDTAESFVIWDNGFTLAYRSTQTTSWFTNFGTKVGTGDQATGHKGTTLVFGATTTMRGTMNLYGCDIRMQGNFSCTMTPATVGTGELINCLFQSSSTSAALSAWNIGNINALDNIYNIDITSSNTADVSGGVGASTVQRVTIGGTGYRGGIQLSAASIRTYASIVFFGTPTRADVLWSASTIVNHHLVVPIWSGNAPKFGFVGSSVTPTLANATLEYWPYDVKIVDGTGAALSGIPVRLTDAIGNVQVDAVTGAVGSLSYGSGLTANTVVVMDHYSDTTQYVQRHRGPFYCEINTANLTGYNSSYASRQYYFAWPGSETVTTSAGSFEAVHDIVNLQEPSGGATNWTECTLA